MFDKYIGEEVIYPNFKQKTKVKQIRVLDSGKQLAELEDGAMLSLDILKTPQGKYLTEIK
ncbi:MAG: hypothetical protein K9L57_06045 [Spirochaetaceae bacterium]|nr:hypothetical protein [Spirochaetaceae bacterium]